MFLPYETPCTQNGGEICDGAGSCIPFPGCRSAGECGASTECTTPTCVSGVCGVSYAAFGTAVAKQVAGDCYLVVCDGAGGLTTVVDDLDLPDDGNQCTEELCSNGVVSHAYRASGTPCNQDAGAICNGSGSCVPDPCANLDDSNQCTADTCESGVPTHVNQPAGTACTDNGGTVCNGLGRCGFCVPGEVTACYSGQGGTAGVGVCLAGTQVCNAEGSGFGPCDGEVTPVAESCNGLDDDCDGVVDNGATCSAIANGTSGCQDGQGVVDTCNTGFANCDGNVGTGCETNIFSDPANCGACGNVCNGYGGTPICVNGVCDIICAAGQGNCDSIAANGCEISLNTSASDCEACGYDCRSWTGDSNAACQGGGTCCSDTTDGPICCPFGETRPSVCPYVCGTYSCNCYTYSCGFFRTCYAQRCDTCQQICYQPCWR